MANRHWEQNKEATVYVGNLDERFGEALMWEMMTQMGPVVNLHMPMDRVSRTHQGYGFVEFDSPESADYAARVLNGVRVYGKVIRVNKASADKQKAAEIGAELFVNNLDTQVDEKILFDAFSRFGQLVTPPHVVRDANNISKGYGFVNFDSFDASDAARDTMNGQYILSKQITVEYAYKKDGKGERHGDEAERKLAAEGKKHNIVPEQQPLPPAYLMSAAPATPATPAAPPGFDPSVAGGPIGGPPPHAGIPPPMVPPSGIPAGFAPPPHMPPVGIPARGGPPSFGMAPPGRPVAGLPSHALPPAPSGLPARPPPSTAAMSVPPNNYMPGAPTGFRGPPPMGMPPPPGQAPPPGFGAPPPGFGPPNGAMPPMPVPGGFMPPPGTGGPPGAPPRGFPARR